MSGDIASRLRGAGLLTAEILYHMPNHPGLLQSFVWQTLDTAPRFPRLARFLDHWCADIEAMIHSVRIAPSQLISPSEWRPVDGEFRLS